jgi:SlyX protein
VKDFSKGDMMNEHCDKRQLDDRIDQLNGQSVQILQQRIDELEMRATFLDDLVESLNGTVAEQSQLLMDLQTQMRLLYSRVDSSHKGDGISNFDAAAEVPPHY